MAGRRGLYGGSSGSSSVNTSLLQNQRLPPPSESLNSVFLSGSSPFLGSRSMVSFEDVNNGGNRSDRPFFRSFDQEENGEDDLEEYFHQPEKKRRLSVDQVQFLERSFELDNKLEPERKVQLAKDLGLQPRQVAIWFQNRRARWKTRQLERDYESLQASFNGLKADYDNLLKEKEKLKSEVLQLTDKLNLKVKDSEISNSDCNEQSKEPLPEPVLESACSGKESKLAIVASKQDDFCSSKSDILDSESPHYADGGHSSFLERGDSSYVLEPDQSDLSQDEEDHLTKTTLLAPPCYGFTEAEDAEYCHDPSAHSSYFVFPVEDQGFGFWSY